MHQFFQKKLLKSTSSNSYKITEEIQSLWSGYGSIFKCELFGSYVDRVVIKHVKFPDEFNHPKGWNSDISHQRKLKSYQVEKIWYENFSGESDERFRMPKCYAVENFNDEVFMVLEDLDNAGYNQRITSPKWSHVLLCIKWLANFHAKYMGVNPKGLWKVGTYWHLETRPDELEVLDDIDLKKNASKIDYILNASNYKTIVHGDAKLANFCFSENEKKVSALDFQYVGQGCGMKDLIYFIGSCFYEEDCAKYESDILEIYFNELKIALCNYHPKIKVNEVEKEWRSMYDISWADFHRFIKGWSPSHWKINSYSEVLTKRVLEKITNVLGKEDLQELQLLAEKTAIKAGGIIQNEKKKGFKSEKKLVGSSEASRIVTKVDRIVESFILNALSDAVDKFDLGVLTEEISDDGTRFEKQYFWCIDPLDGTLPFSEGKSGYSVSISLVSKSGVSVIGVVYDPVNNIIYSAAKGLGATKNGNKLMKAPLKNEQFTLVTDRSFLSSIDKPLIIKKFKDQHNEILVKCIGGAVLNALWVIENQPSCYFKSVKNEIGGGSIWDFSSTACIAIEAGCEVFDSKGNSLNLNPENSTFMNDVGVSFT